MGLVADKTSAKSWVSIKNKRCKWKLGQQSIECKNQSRSCAVHCLFKVKCSFLEGVPQVIQIMYGYRDLFDIHY